MLIIFTITIGTDVANKTASVLWDLKEITGSLRCADEEKKRYNLVKLKGQFILGSEGKQF